MVGGATAKVQKEEKWLGVKGGSVPSSGFTCHA